MSRYRKMFVVLSIFPVLMIFGCKKEPEKHYIPSYIKQYSLFQVGSYWIYKNEMTGLFDSCFIDKPPTISLADLQGMNTDLWETFNIKYNGSFIIESWYMFDQYHMGLLSVQDAFCLSGSSISPGYSYKMSSSKIFSNLFFYDSLIINNKTHFNVMNTEYQEISPTNDTSKYLFYFEKSVGLIKYIYRQQDKDTIWNLVRYHVNY